MPGPAAQMVLVESVALAKDTANMSVFSGTSKVLEISTHQHDITSTSLSKCIIHLRENLIPSPASQTNFPK